MDYKWTALTVTVVGTLMAGIDSRIVIIGLPTIANQLHSGAVEMIWVTQAYVLASTVGMLFIGRVVDIFGRIKLYNAGFVIFTTGSALSAFSLNVFQLIAFRVLQGVGSGILITNASTIITDASPKKELGTMLGINQGALRVGQVAGLTLSGVILSIVDWRGLFYVNIPIGIFGTIWAYKRLREISRKDQARKIDWKGFSLFSVGFTLTLVAVTVLSYGISQIGAGLGLLSVGLILLVLFIKSQYGNSFPMLDLQLFKIKQFAMANVSQALNSITWGGIVLLLAFFMEIGQGYSPLQAGLGILPLDITYTISSVIFGRLSDRYGTRLFTTTGLVINSACFLVMAGFSSNTAYIEIAIFLTILGVGNGMFTPPNLRAIMGSVPPSRIGIASGFRNTMFNMGLTISYGLVVLFITFGIPYNTLSLLLQNAAPQSIIALAKLEFFDGFRIATFILAIIGVVAIIPSAMRGAEEKLQKENEDTKDLA